MAADGGARPPDLRPFRGLLGDLVDLKRVRRAGTPLTVAAELFADGWAALVDGEPAAGVAHGCAARALAATRLGAIDAAVLAAAGLDGPRAHAVLRRAFADAAAPLESAARDALAAALATEPAGTGRPVPDFVLALADQPRAGPTFPGKPRIMLEPPESHAEHCAIVAVAGVVLAPAFGADPADAFLLGMTHHVHNAALPDSGFAGEELLGPELEGVVERLTEGVLATLPGRLAATVRELRPELAGASSPVARTFHAADVIDRVLEVAHHARKAGFTTDRALHDLELVHAGPVQAFHLRALEAAGLP